MDVFLFDNDKRLVDIIPVDEIVEYVQESELNFLITAKLRGEYRANLDDIRYFGSQDVDDPGIFWRYRLDTFTKEDGMFTFTGTHEFFDDMKTRHIHENVIMRDVTASSALEAVLDGSTWQVGRVVDTFPRTMNMFYMTSLDAFWHFLQLYRVEYTLRMTYTNGEITGKFVDLHVPGERDYGRLYEYGNNLIKVIAEQSNTELFTAAYGRGKGELVSLPEEHSSGRAGYRSSHTFSDIEWSKAKGDPVDKPLGQEFVEIPEATAIHGHTDGTPRFGIFKFGDVEDHEELLILTYNQLLDNLRPRADFEADVFESETIHLGEIVNIMRTDMDIRYKTKIYKLERDFLVSERKSIKFGDKIVKERSDQVRELEADRRIEAEDNNTLVSDLIRGIQESYYNDHAYTYNIVEFNENGWGYPAGIYSFDAPIDENPTKVIYFGAGTLMIANSKLSDGNWDWTTVMDGNGMATGIIGADQIMSNAIKSDHIESYAIKGRHIEAGAITAENVSVRDGTLLKALEGLESDIESIELTPGPEGKTRYLHIAYADDINGTGMSPTPAGKRYIGIYTSFNATPSTIRSDYQWSLYTGPKGDKGDKGDQGDQGPQGVPGEKGDDGETTYTWVRYADSATGQGISNNPTGKAYIGFSYNQTSPTESNTPGDYKWSLIKGPQGDTGVQGPPGANGQPTYTWIKYAPQADGTGLTDTPNAQTKYIGIAVNKLTQSESNNKADYQWSKYVGDQGPKGDPGAQGPQGIPGVKGDDGITTYTWVRYADTSTGVGISNDPTGKKYIGLAHNRTTATESNTPGDYKWTLIKGEDGAKGDQGVPGPKGDDGRPTYTWIKYSPNANGSGLTDTPNAQTKYIGIAVNKLTQAESNTPGDYTWSKYVGDQGPKGDKGDQGVPGIQGPPGADGSERWIWIRYADDALGNGMSDYPDGKDFIGVSGNRTTSVESDDPTDYVWSRINDHSRLDELGQLQEELQQAVQGGGRNFLKIGNNRTSDNEYRKVVIEDGLIKWTQKTTATASQIFNTYAPNRAADYVFSMKSSHDQFIRNFLNSSASGTVRGSLTIVDEGDHYFISFPLRNFNPHNLINFYGTDLYSPVQEVHFWDLKLELGTIPTAYSRAPEDIEADIAAAQATANEAVTYYTDIESGKIILGQVQDVHDRVDTTEASIAMVDGALLTKVEDTTLIETKEAIERILDGKADASELEGLTTGWVEQVNSIDQFKLDYKGLETRVEDGEEINQLVTRSLTWDEGWLSIGADNSSTQVQVTDDRINFMDGGEVVAFITGQTLYINSATILSVLQAGNHVTSAYGTNGEITVERWNG